MITVQGARSATPEEWDRIWASCPYATGFHARTWADAWRDATGGRIRPRPLLVEFSDDRHALLPLSVRHACGGLVKKALSGPAGTYGGWIAPDDLGSEHTALLTRLLTRRFSRLEWRANPFDPAGPPALDLPVEEDATQALDLAPGFETVHRGWSKGHRAAARQAERAGVSVTRAESIDDWRAYFGIYRETLGRWGDRTTSEYGWELFEALRARGGDSVRLWLALEDGRPIAGALCLYGPRHVSYWHGAALESDLPKRPVHLLMHAAIRDACERGLSWFDFNPSGGHEGVRAFKAHFGCRTLPAPILRIRPAWRRLADRIKKGACSGS